MSGFQALNKFLVFDLIVNKIRAELSVSIKLHPNDKIVEHIRDTS
jgi:hypothetical protein